MPPPNVSMLFFERRALDVTVELSRIAKETDRGEELGNEGTTTRRTPLSIRIRFVPARPEMLTLCLNGRSLTSRACLPGIGPPVTPIVIPGSSLGGASKNWGLGLAPRPNRRFGFYSQCV